MLWKPKLCSDWFIVWLKKINSKRKIESRWLPLYDDLMTLSLKYPSSSASHFVLLLHALSVLYWRYEWMYMLALYVLLSISMMWSEWTKDWKRPRAKATTTASASSLTYSHFHQPPPHSKQLWEGVRERRDGNETSLIWPLNR